MSTWIRHLLLLVISGILSWWVFLHQPATELTPATDIVPPPAVVELIPMLASALPSDLLEPQLDTPDPDEEIAALPPERGDPERLELPDVELATSKEALDLVQTPSAEETDSKGAAASEPKPEPRAEDMMRDPTLLALADAELRGERQKGFATVFLAAPEDQLDIANFFGEEVVLVPRSALDLSDPNPSYFRMTGGTTPRVEAVVARPDLEQYRQYRDLFDYEYARLPSELRALRRSVLARSEVYLFAALIPRQEWAVVIARRNQALRSAGRGIEEVKGFVIRYLRRDGGGFEVLVEEIQFTDRSRFRPRHESKGI